MKKLSILVILILLGTGCASVAPTTVSPVQAYKNAMQKWSTLCSSDMDDLAILFNTFAMTSSWQADVLNTLTITESDCMTMRSYSNTPVEFIPVQKEIDLGLADYSAAFSYIRSGVTNWDNDALVNGMTYMKNGIQHINNANALNH